MPVRDGVLRYDNVNYFIGSIDVSAASYPRCGHDLPYIAAILAIDQNMLSILRDNIPDHDYKPVVERQPWLR